MIHRAMPTRSTVTYGSLQHARPSRYGLQFTDRIAVCSDCGAARRIDVDDTFYTHLSGETRTLGSDTEWVECLGSGQRVILEPVAVAAPVSAPLPAVLRPTIGATLRENLLRIRRLEDLIQIRQDHIVRMDSFGRDLQYSRIQEHRRAINLMLAENEFLAALEAA